MKNAKKLLALFLALVMLVSTLAACGENKTDEATGGRARRDRRHIGQVQQERRVYHHRQLR